MAIIKGTSFLEIYESFLSKITDDMYMQLTLEDTYQILRELLLSSINKFEFPRQSLKYYLKKLKREENDNTIIFSWYFVNKLTDEEINILSSYMIVEWIGQQLASIENTRMKYSGSDFKFTSQANHMQKLLQLKKDYEREGFHLQRLYKRRIKDKNGIYRSTFSQLMEKPCYSDTNSINGNDFKEQETTIENFALVKGDTFTFDVVISDIQNAEVNSLYFSVKKDDSNEYLFQKSLDNGITLIDILRYRVRIAPQDTSDIMPGKYNYDLKLGLGTDIYTVMMGILTIKEDITKRGTTS